MVCQTELLSHMDIDAPFQCLAQRAVIRITHVDQWFATILIEMDDTLFGHIIRIDGAAVNATGT
ncbi:hypothetical protein D3C80_1654810 [compost metagenome]